MKLECTRESILWSNVQINGNNQEDVEEQESPFTLEIKNNSLYI